MTSACNSILRAPSRPPARERRAFLGFCNYGSKSGLSSLSPVTGRSNENGLNAAARFSGKVRLLTLKVERTASDPRARASATAFTKGSGARRLGSSARAHKDSLVRFDASYNVRGDYQAFMAREDAELRASFRSRGWFIWRLEASVVIHDATMHGFPLWWLRALRSGCAYAQVWQKRGGSSISPQVYIREFTRGFGCAAAIAIL